VQRELHGKRREYMEKTEVRGLSREELETQHAQLLPERIEMRRRRRRRRFTCDASGPGASVNCISESQRG